MIDGSAGRAAGATLEDQFPIVAAGRRGGVPTRVLKEGETFGVFDMYGDVASVRGGDYGIYHMGTRHLSRLELRIGGERPLLLSSTVREDNDVLSIDLTNPEAALADGGALPRDVLHVYRSIFLWGGSCYERMRMVAFTPAACTVTLSFTFDADFADIFEIRGTRRPRRGERRPVDVTGRGLLLRYVGLDDVERRTRIAFTPEPTRCDGATATFELRLQPRQPVELDVSVTCESDEIAVPEALSCEGAMAEMGARLGAARSRRAHLTSANEQMSAWMQRSTADLQMLMTETADGPYPYAGVPWFSTVFGRDGLITAWQLLWLDPGIARGVLGFLARTQAVDVDPANDAEPGKIVHEMRHGEMAALGEIPFGRYYGTVDATPLFVLLAGEYWRRTADRAFIASLWPAIERALAWMDTYGDPDGDGFIEYHRRSADGLVQQGWKDSHDSIFHADGALAEPPIALCEVQAYAYGARLGAAEIAAALDLPDRAAALSKQAEDLRARFEAAFWLDDLSTYALALDGRKRPCRVVSSNAGHCLATGLPSQDRAARVAARLMADDTFSGWGVRTIAWDQTRYNPMSYHNGSVWPHDTALVAFGFGRYGLTDLAGRLLGAMFEASRYVDLNRMPELFCGFRRRPGQGPTLYPVACAPQAWAAGSVFMLLQACLGITIDAVHHRVTFRSGRLPGFLPWLEISHMRVGEASLDVLLQHHAMDLGINVLRREGDVEIVAVK